MPKITSLPPTNLKVVALVYDGLCTFEFGIAVEIFGLPRPEVDTTWYQFAVASVDDGLLRATGGIQVVADGGLDLLETAGAIVIPGWKGVDVPLPPRLATALQVAYQRGVRLITICSGVFVLAAAGLLEGRQATTHWRYSESLANRYPSIHVKPDVLYIDAGQIITSAGSAAGIDACLHLVRRDFGAKIANQVARRLVVSPHRDGGQQQYIEKPVSKERESTMLGGLFDWLRTHLHEPLPIACMAEQVSMSKRTFLRRFNESTGMSPGEWLLAERLALAKELLEISEHTIDTVAERCGFGCAATLRHHFRQQVGISPSTYRKQYCRRVSLSYR